MISETSFLITPPDFSNSVDSTTWNRQFPANLLVDLQTGSVANNGTDVLLQAGFSSEDEFIWLNFNIHRKLQRSDVFAFN